MMKLQGSPDDEYIELSQPFEGAGWHTVTFDSLQLQLKHGLDRVKLGMEMQTFQD